MLNTLANHSLLPHNSEGIAEDMAKDAFLTTFNVNQSIARILFDPGLSANPAPITTSFSFDNLNRHSILEYDASLRYVALFILLLMGPIRPS